MFNSILPACIWLDLFWSRDTPSLFHSPVLIPLLWACHRLPPPYLGNDHFETGTKEFSLFLVILQAKTFLSQQRQIIPHVHDRPKSVLKLSSELLVLLQASKALRLRSKPHFPLTPCTVNIMCILVLLLFHFVIIAQMTQHTTGKMARKERAKIRATFDVGWDKYFF